MGLNLKHIKGRNVSPPAKMVIARKISNKFRKYQIHHFKFLKSDTPYCSAYIWVPWYRAEIFLFSRQRKWGIQTQHFWDLAKRKPWKTITRYEIFCQNLGEIYSQAYHNGSVHKLRNNVRGGGVTAHMMTMIMPSGGGGGHQKDHLLHKYFCINSF